MRTDDGHISVVQGVLLMFAVFSAMLYLQYPAYLVEEGGPAAWQVGLVITLLSLVTFWPMARLAARFPGERLTAIGDQVVGRWLGRLLALAVAAWLLGAAAITLRNFTETFITTLLPNTPPSALMVVVLLVVIYTAGRGLEPLARVSQIFFPVIIAGSLIVLAADIPQGDGRFLYPILGHGAVTTLWGGVYYTSMSAEIILLLIAGSSFRCSKGVGRAGLWALLLIGATASVTAAVLVMVFGAPDAARLPLPLYNLARVVHLGRFFQRLESLIVMFWFFAASARLAALVWGTAITVSDSFGLPHYRPLLWPVGIMVMAVAFLPKDYITVFRVERDVVRPLGWVILAIPVLLWLVALARGKGGKSNAA